MNFPITQTFNTFHNPYQILDMAKSMSYSNNPNYPGVRTGFLHELEFDFYLSYCQKILRLFYSFEELDKVNFSATSQFQKITKKDLKLNKSWVHIDSISKLTVITYLTDNADCGTNFFLPKKTGALIKDDRLKKQFYSGEQVDMEEYINQLNKNNNQYYNVSKINSVFNSTVTFDGNYPHAESLYGLNEGEERYTMITFFNDIVAPRYPVAEMNRVI